MLSSSFTPPPSSSSLSERTMDDANNLQKYKMLKRKLREMMEVLLCKDDNVMDINDSFL